MKNPLEFLKKVKEEGFVEVGIAFSNDTRAIDHSDLIEIADALGDMLYILCGTIIEHGLQHKIEDVFDEIQRSNMSKLDHDGKPIYREDGKVMKGPNYFKPDFSKII